MEMGELQRAVRLMDTPHVARCGKKRGRRTQLLRLLGIELAHFDVGLHRLQLGDVLQGLLSHGAAVGHKQLTKLAPGVCPATQLDHGRRRAWWSVLKQRFVAGKVVHHQMTAPWRLPLLAWSLI